MPNRLTLLYSKIHYKKENYLKVKTAVFKYINSSIVKFSTSVHRYIWYISIAKSSKQSVKWYREMITQLIEN